MVIISNIPVANFVATKSTYNPLGFVAKSTRRISYGSEFNKYFEQAKGTITTIHPDASVYDTLTLMERIIKTTSNQTAAITKYLESISSSDQDFLKNLFKFLYSHIQYEQDTQGIEQLREPIRTWKDKKADCDCFSIFISSVLHNYKGGIKHSLRIIRMKGQETFHHVYIVVPKNKNGKITDRSSYWVVDPVLDAFDQEAEYIVEKHDKALSGKIPTRANLSELNGIVPIGSLKSTIGGMEFTLDVSENNHFVNPTDSTWQASPTVNPNTGNSSSPRNNNSGGNGTPANPNAGGGVRNETPAPNPTNTTNSTGILTALAALVALALGGFLLSNNTNAN